MNIQQVEIQNQNQNQNQNQKRNQTEKEAGERVEKHAAEQAKAHAGETQTQTGTQTGTEHRPISGGGKSSNTPTNVRYVRASVRREVFQRDGRQCTYRDWVSGRRCSSEFQLELDHVKEFALGGETTAENLRVRCRMHNKLHAIQTYGVEKMAQFAKTRSC